MQNSLPEGIELEDQQHLDETQLTTENIVMSDD